MTKTTISEEFVLDCSPEVAFEAWLDSGEHGKMIESEGDAKIDPSVGGKFSIWDGAITGENLEIDRKNPRIVQSWRYEYEDWPKDKPSRITLEFTAYNERQTKVRFNQTDIPPQHRDDIEEGWRAYYFAPMKRYFAK